MAIAPKNTHKLTPAQVMALSALAEKRDRFMNQIQAAFDALADAYAAIEELPSGAYEFDPRPNGDVYLVPKGSDA